tara:strand:+ start:40 stop:738 length:699 start_codon:yes stop_codon:yes gene_type:complete
MLLEALGLTPEQIAENEEYDVRKGRKRDTGDRIGDRVMSFLTGTNYAKEVGEKTQELDRQKKRDVYGSDVDKLRGIRGYEDIGDLSKLTERQIKTAITDRRATKGARSKAAALTGLDRGKFLELTDPGEIEALASRLLTEKTEKKEADTKREAEQRYNTEREDRIARERENDRRYYQERADNLEFKRDQLMFQKAEAMRADARLAQDRKDKAIAILMSGLGNLGEAFAGMTV